MRLTGPARILRPNMFEHDQAGRDVLKLLASLLADLLTFQPTLGTGTILGGDIVDDSLARQACGQGFSATVARRCGRRYWFQCGPGSGRLDDLGGEEQQLGGIDGFAFFPKLLAEELFELMLEFGDEQILLAKCLRQFDDRRVGGGQVIGE